MDHLKNIYDPLQLDIRRQTALFLSQIPADSIHVPALSSASTNKTLLEILSQLLSEPSLTLLVAKIYRPILFDLCARWLEVPGDAVNRVVALALLVEIHEEVAPCV